MAGFGSGRPEAERGEHGRSVLLQKERIASTATLLPVCFGGVTLILHPICKLFSVGVVDLSTCSVNINRGVDLLTDRRFQDLTLCASSVLHLGDFSLVYHLQIAEELDHRRASMMSSFRLKGCFCRMPEEGFGGRVLKISCNNIASRR